MVSPKEQHITKRITKPTSQKVRKYFMNSLNLQFVFIPLAASSVLSFSFSYHYGYIIANRGNYENLSRWRGEKNVKIMKVKVRAKKTIIRQRISITTSYVKCYTYKHTR